MIDFNKRYWADMDDKSRTPIRFGVHFIEYGRHYGDEEHGSMRNKNSKWIEFDNESGTVAICREIEERIVLPQEELLDIVFKEMGSRMQKEERVHNKYMG